MKEVIINGAILVAVVAVLSALIYGSIYIGKSMTYKVFFEGMVKDTITEMVQEGALK